MKPLRILLVGAGSVGQVYGHHFQQGGADVRFLVRPKYVDASASGYTLHHLHRKRCDTLTFQPTHFGDTAAATRGGVDAVVLCMSYAGLKGDWFEKLLHEVEDATIVSLVPGGGARAWLEERVRADRLVHGMITLLAYPAPLPGEELSPGTAFWFPPFSPAPFSGARERAQPIVDLLNRGGQPARWSGPTQPSSDLATCFLMPLLASLEVEGWSFDKLAKSPLLSLACEGGRDAMRVVCADRGGPPTLPVWALQPRVVRGVMKAARLLAPVDIEAFFQLHFTKVGAQTRLILDEWATQATQNGMNCQKLLALQEALSTHDQRHATP